jgi:alpha-tubulin suppressor-like RCC1 family protein
MPISARRLRSLLPCSILSVAAACGRGPSEPDNAAPSVSITEPSSGLEAFDHVEVTFTASASDPEDGNLTSAIAWSSSLDGSLGTGGSITAYLSPGAHTIAASVRDADGANGSANVSVTSIEFEWIWVTSGTDHSCGIALGGRTFCWGSNGDDQIGSGTAAEIVDAPAEVSGDHRFEFVSAGSVHTCGVLLSGGAMCWGSRSQDEGILGNGSLGGSPTPVAVTHSGSFQQLAAGTDYTCALSSDGVAYCWGWNWAGTLGDGSDPTVVDEATTPVQVSTPARFNTIDAGVSHVCGVTANWETYCWGGSGAGEIGDGQVRDWALVPTLVSGSTRWSHAAAGEAYSTAVDTDRQPWFWGSRIRLAGLGYQDPSDLQPTPEMIPTAERYAFVEAGPGYACGIAGDGLASCWGQGYSQPSGPRGTQPPPVPVGAGESYEQLALGGTHVCGLTFDHRILCWGQGSAGQLGDGLRSTSSSPVEVLDPT